MKKPLPRSLIDALAEVGIQMRGEQDAEDGTQAGAPRRASAGTRSDADPRESHHYRASIQKRLGMLTELAEMGMLHVRLLEEQRSTDGNNAEIAKVLEMMGRSVRQTLALRARIERATGVSEPRLMATPLLSPRNQGRPSDAGPGKNDILH